MVIMMASTLSCTSSDVDIVTVLVLTAAYQEHTPQDHNLALVKVA